MLEKLVPVAPKQKYETVLVHLQKKKNSKNKFLMFNF